MNSAALPLSIAMLAFITLPNNCLLFIALVQFCAESLSKNKINATPLLFLVSLSFIIVTFTTLPYLENIRYKSLLVREKGKLDTYTVLLLGANPPLISSGGAGPGDPKSASLSWGSSPTVRCPSQLPWHHGSREGSGSVDEKVAAVAPLPGSPLTHALEAGLGAGAFADVFMRAGSAAWERGDERTIVFTGSPGGSESHTQTRPLTTPREPACQQPGTQSLSWSLHSQSRPKLMSSRETEVQSSQGAAGF